MLITRYILLRLLQTAGALLFLLTLPITAPLFALGYVAILLVEDYQEYRSKQ